MSGLPLACALCVRLCVRASACVHTQVVVHLPPHLLSERDPLLHQLAPLHISRDHLYTLGERAAGRTTGTGEVIKTLIYRPANISGMGCAAAVGGLRMLSSCWLLVVHVPAEGLCCSELIFLCVAHLPCTRLSKFTVHCHAVIPHCPC